MAFPVTGRVHITCLPVPDQLEFEPIVVSLLLVSFQRPSLLILWTPCWSFLKDSGAPFLYSNSAHRGNTHRGFSSSCADIASLELLNRFFRSRIIISSSRLYNRTKPSLFQSLDSISHKHKNILLKSKSS